MTIDCKKPTCPVVAEYAAKGGTARAKPFAAGAYDIEVIYITPIVTALEPEGNTEGPGTASSEPPLPS